MKAFKSLLKKITGLPWEFSDNTDFIEGLIFNEVVEGAPLIADLSQNGNSKLDGKFLNISANYFAETVGLLEQLYEFWCKGKIWNAGDEFVAQKKIATLLSRIESEAEKAGE